MKNYQISEQDLKQCINMLASVVSNNIEAEKILNVRNFLLKLEEVKKIEEKKK